MKLTVGAREKIRYHVGTLPIYMRFLKIELRILLIAFSGETDVIKLHFIDATCGGIFCQCDVVILDFGPRGVRPYQFPFFAPGLIVATRPYG